MWYTTENPILSTSEYLYLDETYYSHFRKTSVKEVLENDLI